MRVFLLVLLGAAACGRIQFDPFADAAITTDDAADDTITPPLDGAPPMLCSNIGFTCLNGGTMKCGDSCYVWCNELATQDAAGARCTAWSGGLASIASAAEQTCISSLATNDAWIGLIQDVGASAPDAGWRWMDGTVAPIAGWTAGEPEDGGAGEDGTEQCAIQGGGGWLDAKCGDSKPFICKRPAL